MKRIIISLCCVLFFLGCGSTAAYNTLDSRNSEFRASNVTVSDSGLSKSEIDSILSTKFPLEPPFSISIIYLKDMRRYYSSQDLMPQFINELQQIEWIERIVKIPNRIIPKEMSFESIQELGIRSLCEYTFIFFADTYSVFDFRKTLSGVYEITSELDFLVIDNQAAAIIASDKLISKMETKINIFEKTEKEKAMSEIFSEQSKLLKTKITNLFKY